MRFFKTTDNGGLPLFLDDIRWFEGGMMDAFISILSSFEPRNLVGTSGTGTPPTDAFILSGLKVTNASGSYTWTDGYVYISGLIYKVPASTAPLVPSLGDSIYIEPDVPIFSPFGNKLFRNLVYHDTYGTRMAKVVILPKPQDGKLNLLKSDRLQWGNVGVQPEQTFGVPTGWILDTAMRGRILEYGDVTLKGRVVWNGGSPLLFTLPAEMRPLGVKLFPMMDMTQFKTNAFVEVLPDGKVLLELDGSQAVSGVSKYDLSSIRFRAGI